MQVDSGADSAQGSDVFQDSPSNPGRLESCPADHGARRASCQVQEQ